MIVRSRGESILLSQAIEISLEEENAFLSVKEKSPSAANGPPLRCSKYNNLGHTANKCPYSDRFPAASDKAIMSSFNCGREGHVARDRRQKPSYRSGVGRDMQSKNGVGRDTDNLNKAHSKGWNRSGNGERELSSNPMATRRNK
jgi:hypothetical protein